MAERRNPLLDFFSNTSSYWANQGRQLGNALGTNSGNISDFGIDQPRWSNIVSNPPPGGEGTSNLFRNPRIERGYNKAEGSILTREDENTQSMLAALGLIGDARGRIEGGREARETSLANYDINPFTDEEREMQQQVLFDIISNEVENSRRTAQLNMTSRGLGGGSQAYETGQGIIERGAGEKAREASGLMQRQEDVNQAALNFRETMLSQISSIYEPLETRLGSLEAMLQAGNVVDPALISTLIQDAMSADQGRSNFEDIMEYAREQAANDEEIDWGAIGQLWAAGLAPGSGLLQVGAATANEIWG